MKPELATPLCPFCQQTARLVPVMIRHRRGERVLPVDTWSWECTGGCADPGDGASPFQFADLPLMEWDGAHAAAVWLAHFGEPMPSSARPRLPRQQRTIRIPLLVTEEEARELDNRRGRMSRNEYIRRAIKGGA